MVHVSRVTWPAATRETRARQTNSSPPFIVTLRHAAKMAGQGQPGLAEAPAVPSGYRAVVRDLAAGTVGGMLGVLVSHPLDFVKVRQQTNLTAGGTDGLSVMLTAVRAEGATAVYKGVLPPLLSCGLVNAVVFVAHGAFMRHFSGNGTNVGGSELLTTTLGGCYAGFFSAIVSNPTELVKCRLQVDIAKTPSSTWSMARRIIRKEGLIGLNRGFMTCLLRDMPSFGVYFGVFGWSKQVLTKAAAGPNGEKGTGLAARWLPTLVAGGLAGIVAWSSIYPVDTVKSVIQTQPVGKPTGFVTVLKAHVNAHGARYLWSGFSACMARAFILNGATFFGYEYTLERLDERLDE